MLLSDRIREIGVRRINHEFVAAFSLPVVVNALCKEAFVQRWEYESEEGLRDCANIRKAAKLFDKDEWRGEPLEVAPHELAGKRV